MHIKKGVFHWRLYLHFVDSNSILIAYTNTRVYFGKGTPSPFNKLLWSEKDRFIVLFLLPSSGIIQIILIKDSSQLNFTSLLVFLRPFHSHFNFSLWNCRPLRVVIAVARTVKCTSTIMQGQETHLPGHASTLLPGCTSTFTDTLMNFMQTHTCARTQIRRIIKKQDEFPPHSVATLIAAW